MANIVRTVIQFRRDTTENWLLHQDVVPAAGEPCFDLNLGTLKIGDGIKSYAELEVVGGSGSITVSADQKSIVLEDSVFKLMGFDDAEVGAQPRKNAEGQLEWVVPSTETDEGLQVTIADMQSDIEAIQEILTPSEEGVDPLATRVKTLETKMDGTGEGTVDAKIDAKINDFAEKISSDGTINTFKELVDYVAKHNNEAIQLASDIAKLQGLVGDASVSSQISSAISGKVDKETGKSLVEDTLIAKLESIEASAQANKIESVSAGGTVLKITEKNVNIPVATADVLGVVKGSTEILIAENGVLEVGSININKIVQDEENILIMDGGSASA